MGSADLLLHLKPLLLRVVARALALTLLTKATALHDPLLLRNRTAELLVVRDNDHLREDPGSSKATLARPVATLHCDTIQVSSAAASACIPLRISYPCIFAVAATQKEAMVKESPA